MGFLRLLAGTMTDNGIQEKALVDDRVLDRTVQKQPDYMTFPGSDVFVITVSSFADDLPAWGRNVRLRDRKLREFWPTEPIIASAIQTIVAARANMSWSLDGPPRTVGIVQRMLQSSNLGKGWLDLRIKVLTDQLTQDNGAFVEIVRQEDSPTSPVLNLAHLDAGRCIRTGIPETPVIYYDREGHEHKLKWYQVLTFEDMPSPIEEMNSLQVCFLSRVLRAAQIIKDFGIYKREKIAGRNPGEIHFVSGVQTKLINDKLADDQHEADNRGYSRFMLPTIIGSLDPNSTVSTASIDLRSVPDGFDEDTTLRWYIAQIAMAAGADYQDFAPLSSGNLGTSQQSEVLDRKSRGKGQETDRKLWEHKLNFNGILPHSVTFAFDEKDIESDIQQADLEDKQAKIFSTYYDKGQGVLPLPVIHQMMADQGILKPEYMALLNTQDVTPDIVATDDVQAPTESELEEAADTPSTDIAESQPEEIPAEVRTTTIPGSLKKKTQQKQIDTDEYESILADLMNEAAAGTITEDEFLIEAESLVAAEIINTYLLASGKTIAQLTDEDRQIISEQTEINLDAIPGLYLASVAFGGDEDTPTEELIDNRVTLWGNSILGVYALGFLRGGDDTQPIGWILGARDHCDDCLRLSTIVETREQWRTSGWYPKSHSLACKGFNCGCEFAEVDEPLTGGL